MVVNVPYSTLDGVTSHLIYLMTLSHTHFLKDIPLAFISISTLLNSMSSYYQTTSSLSADLDCIS